MDRKENQTYLNNYELSHFPKKKLFPLLTLIFLFGLIFNFSLKDLILDSIKTGLSSIPGCSIGYSDINLSVMYFEIVLKDPVIPGKCIGIPSQSISLQDLYIKFRGINFNPFSPKIIIETKLNDSHFIISPALGLSEQNIKIVDTVVDIDSLPPLSPALKNISGRLNVNALIFIKDSKFSEGKFTVTSKNFRSLPQSAGFVSLPLLALNEIGIEAKVDSKSMIRIVSSRIGDSNSPIRAEITGALKTGSGGLASTTFDLKIMKLTFSPEFSQEMPFVESFIQNQGVKAENGAYNFSLKGAATLPQISPL